MANTDHSTGPSNGTSKELSKQKWVFILSTVLISGLLTLWGVYGIKRYGIALFILTPLFIGFSPVALYMRKQDLSRKKALLLGLQTLLIFSCGLVVFAIEGLICIAMAAPPGIALTLAGSLIAHRVSQKNSRQANALMLLLLGSIPAMAFVEKNDTPELTAVKTSITIDASPETVWKNVVAFPRLQEPKEFIFKTGIAYPIDAKIIGSGAGAVRHCNFTTGSFVEPITQWDEPRLLKFDVIEQPEPMKELSFWDIDAPHLHNYFVSKHGQFRLTKVSEGKTLLEGTTWYYHKISPAAYWQIWSNHIIHSIHRRVLSHIKDLSENQTNKKQTTD